MRNNGNAPATRGGAQDDGQDCPSYSSHCAAYRRDARKDIVRIRYFAGFSSMRSMPNM